MMTTTPHTPVAPPDKDIDHLNLLSIFQFVMAGLTGIGALAPIAYIVIGLLMMGGTIDDADAPSWLGGAMIGFGIGLMALMGLMAYLVYRCGMNLRRQRKWTYCVVIAAIECLSVPFGTILGVFTLVVLNRPSVKSKFR